jgi:hypothetical protein
MSDWTQTQIDSETHNRSTGRFPYFEVRAAIFWVQKVYLCGWYTITVHIGLKYTNGTGNRMRPSTRGLSDQY